LSYCWGGPQKITLTRGSFGRFLQGVPISKFGKMIRDAVRVTRELGIRHLWVDAVCIMQDIDEDKAVQLKRMCDIYEMATVTIAAADAVTHTEGFLKSLDCTEGNTIQHMMPFSAGGIALLHKNEPRLSRGFRDFPLNTRAWTLQELLLSRRVLFMQRRRRFGCAVEKNKTPSTERDGRVTVLPSTDIGYVRIQNCRPGGEF
jgi:hypothetical protein